MSYVDHHSHCPQVVLAKEAGLSYAAIAMPTDYDCWKEGQVVDVTAVMEVKSPAISTCAHTQE